MDATSNALNWFEISVNDIARAKTFYETIFSVEMQEMEMMGMKMAMFPMENMNGKINGRIQDKTKHSPQIEFAVKSKFLINKLFTETAKKICRERIIFFENFLNRLEQEINGEL